MPQTSGLTFFFFLISPGNKIMFTGCQVHKIITFEHELITSQSLWQKFLQQVNYNIYKDNFIFRPFTPRTITITKVVIITLILREEEVTPQLITPEE